MTLTSSDQWIDVPSDDFYYTDAISDHAVQYLRELDEERSGDAFFLYVAYTAPHWPLHALEEDIARYERKYDMGWDVLRE
jgi:arylsulfatase